MKEAENKSKLLWDYYQEIEEVGDLSLLVYLFTDIFKKIDKGLIALMPQVSLLCSAKICLLNKVLVQNNLSKGDAEWLLQPWLIGSSFFKLKDSQDIFILRSHLLNSWLITARVLVWQCIKAWGIHITSVLSSELEGYLIFSQRRTWQRPKLGTKIPQLREWKLSSSCLPVRCNQESSSPNELVFPSSRRCGAPVCVQRRGQGFSGIKSVLESVITSYC